MTDNQTDNQGSVVPISRSDNDVYAETFISHLDPAFRLAAGNIEVSTIDQPRENPW